MILIALGANLPGPDGAPALETLQRAAALLDGLCGAKLVAISRWYNTAPVPPSPGTPDYVNGVARLEGEVDPAVLLAATQAIENRFGRVRPYLNAPRTLDLDLIDVNGIVRDGPDPILPHPRAHQRRFVLEPLMDVAPDWVHPRLHASATELLKTAE